MATLTYNPIDYGFHFTDDGWYTFDYAAAHKAALKARNAVAKELKARGYKTTCRSHPGQLISMGGIGSGQPHIEQVVTVYDVYYY